MTKLSKKNMTYLLILVSIVVLVFGIVLSITIGAKDMNLSTVIDSLIKMEDGINMRIVKGNSSCTCWRIFSSFRGNNARNNEKSYS